MTRCLADLACVASVIGKGSKKNGVFFSLPLPDDTCYAGVIGRPGYLTNHKKWRKREAALKRKGRTAALSREHHQLFSCSVEDDASQLTTFSCWICQEQLCSQDLLFGHYGNHMQPFHLYHPAAMLSLRRIKALFLHDEPHTEFASGQGLPRKNKAFILLRLNMAAE